MRSVWSKMSLKELGDRRIPKYSRKVNRVDSHSYTVALGVEVVEDKPWTCNYPSRSEPSLSVGSHTMQFGHKSLLRTQISRDAAVTYQSAHSEAAIGFRKIGHRQRSSRVLGHFTSGEGLTSEVYRSVSFEKSGYRPQDPIDGHFGQDGHDGHATPTTCHEPGACYRPHLLVTPSELVGQAVKSRHE